MAINILLSNDEESILKEILELQRRAFLSQLALHGGSAPPEIAARFETYASIERKLGVDVEGLSSEQVSAPEPMRDIAAEQLAMTQRMQDQLPSRLERISSLVLSAMFSYNYIPSRIYDHKAMVEEAIAVSRKLIAQLATCDSLLVNPTV
jgi:hypothetical protein